MSLFVRSKLTWALSCLLIASCGRDLPSPAAGPIAPRVTTDGGSTTEATLVRLEVSPARVIVDAGTTIQLAVTGIYDDGSRVDLTAPALGTKYESGAPRIAEVDERGFVRAHSPGAALIRVANGDLSANARIEVRGTTAPTIVALKLIAPEQLELGSLVSYQVLGATSDGQEVDLTFDDAVSVTTDDPSVVGVEGDSLLSARGPGRTTLTAAYVRGDTRLIAQQPLVVREAEDPWVELRFFPDTVSLALGQTAVVTLFGFRASGSVADLTFSPEVRYALVGPVALARGAAGLELSATRSGRAQITATFGALETTLPVVIGSTTQTTSIVITAPATIREGDRAQFQVLAVQSDGSVNDVTLDPQLSVISSRPRVLQVSPGVIEGLAQGFSELDATYLGFLATATVRVVAAPDPIQALMWQPAGLVMRLGDRPLVQLMAVDLSGVQSNVSRDPGAAVRVLFGSISLISVSGGFEVRATALGSALATASYGGFNADLGIDVIP